MNMKVLWKCRPEGIRSMVVSDICATYIHQTDRISDAQTNLLTSPYTKGDQIQDGASKDQYKAPVWDISPKTVCWELWVDIRKLKMLNTKVETDETLFYCCWMKSNMTFLLLPWLRFYLEVRSLWNILMHHTKCF